MKKLQRSTSMAKKVAEDLAEKAKTAWSEIKDGPPTESSQEPAVKKTKYSIDNRAVNNK